MSTTVRDYLFLSTRPTSRDFIDLAGQRFGRLTVIGLLPRRANAHVYWLCRCDCGAASSPTTGKLRQRLTFSCGCQSLERRTATARRLGGVTRLASREYSIFYKIRARCLSPTDPAYCDYGGRGIKVCDRWLHGDGKVGGFVCFLRDMGPRPSLRHSVDRKNNDGNYEPDNCRWATDKQQARNRRSNRIVVLNGEKMAVGDACDRLGLRYKIVIDRLKRGWSFERAISQAVRGAA